MKIDGTLLPPVFIGGLKSLHKNGIWFRGGGLNEIFTLVLGGVRSAKSPRIL
jgi:hypothetical protein